MSMSGVQVNPDVDTEYKTNFQTRDSDNKNTRPWYIVFRIQDKSDGKHEIAIVQKGPVKTPKDEAEKINCEEAYAQLLEFFTPDKPCYALFAFGDEDPGKHIFIAWTPDTANVKQKMLYSSSKGVLIKKFVVSVDIQGSDLDDVKYDEVKKLVDAKKK